MNYDCVVTTQPLEPDVCIDIRKIREQYVDWFKQLTGDTDIKTRIVRNKSTFGGYIKLFPSAVGLQWLLNHKDVHVYENGQRREYWLSTGGAIGDKKSIPFMQFCEKMVQDHVPLTWQEQSQWRHPFKIYFRYEYEEIPYLELTVDIHLNVDP